MWIYKDFVNALSMNDDPPTLYSIMESMVNYERDDEDQVKIKDLPEYCHQQIFNFGYPLSPTISKHDFEVMFLKHYMFRRINYDTFTSFQIHLDTKLNTILPKYNKMLEGFDKIVFDGVIETHTRQTLDSRESSSTGTSSSNSSASGDTDNRYSDTPQNNISDVKDGSYVTDYTFNQTSSNSSASTTSGSHSNDSGRVDEEIRIVRGDPIEEYSKYLEVMNSIYEMIFKECDSLFYGII